MVGVAAVAVVLPQETCNYFVDAVVSYCNPKDVAYPNILIIVFDWYSNISIKESTHIKRGQPSHRVCITSMMKNIPKQDDWNKFLNNEEIIINLNQYKRNVNIH